MALGVSCQTLTKHVWVVQWLWGAQCDLFAVLKMVELLCWNTLGGG